MSPAGSSQIEPLMASAGSQDASGGRRALRR